MIQCDSHRVCLTGMTRSLLVVILILVVFGLIVLSSAGIIESQKTFGSSYYYLNHQLLYGVLPGLFLMFLFFKIDYKFWKKVALPILFGTLLMMVFVFLPQFGYGLKGADRWLNVGGFSFQPSEALKLSLIIYFAAWFGGRNERIKNWGYGIAPFFHCFVFCWITSGSSARYRDFSYSDFNSPVCLFFCRSGNKTFVIDSCYSSCYFGGTYLS